MAHVPVIVISPSDRRLEGIKGRARRGEGGRRFSGGPVIHSKLDVGTAGTERGLRRLSDGVGKRRRDRREW